MIAKNFEYVDLSKESKESKEIKDQFDWIKKNFKFPIRITFPKTSIVEDPDNPGKLMMPNSHVINLTSTEYTDKGTVTWTYYTRALPKKDKPTKYLPGTLTLTKDIFLPETDIEKAWFLIYKSDRCENNKFVGTKKRAMFQLVHEENDAIDFISHETIKATVEHNILVAFSEKQLRQVYSHYGLTANLRSVKYLLSLFVDVSVSQKKDMKSFITKPKKTLWTPSLAI